MKQISHIIRIKKYKPFYELYDVVNNTIKFKKDFNDYKGELESIRFARIVLSSALCVEGSRDLPMDKKILKLNADEFFFDHTILSSRSELYFSPPSTENNQLKQFWLNKKDYSRFVKPILEILKNKAEYIMSEKSSFVIEKDKNIELSDGHISHIFKINKNGNIESQLTSQKHLNENNNFNDLFVNYEISGLPKIISNRKSNFSLILTFILLIFIFLNFLIVVPKFYPLLELRINYYLSDLKIKKIKNADEIISLDNVITKSLKREIPGFIINSNTFIEKLPSELLNNLVSFDFNSNSEIKITFKNYDLNQINNFINENKSLTIDTYLKNELLVMTIKGF